ncbi:MAG: cyclase family protein [Clostridia bacterium]|nr:cyclase family protein [Clostridia bacterium]
MIIDLTGTLYTGMWNYEPPFPALNIRPLPPVPWVSGYVGCEIFEGLHSQTGTYLETPAHVLGDASYPLLSVSLSRITDVPAVILHLPYIEPNMPITETLLEACSAFHALQPGDAVLVSCNYGQKWFDADYLSASPYFTKAAMLSLIAKKPSILGSDFPRWDNLAHPQGFFGDFYNADILMLAPLVQLEKCPANGGKLTALPLKAEKTSCAPCRAILQV